ncbi:MAG: 1-acyl-sn-glycerol-3-phosphate acyltransferase [Candidatus Nanopelagicales bacterium]|jgi:glycerol-3-phosphate O-acyltransferase|nr:1-acyl-sn-glycerol-3-phosphate acyltransferase [Candidatus Nanopelagicales bacterium]
MPRWPGSDSTASTSSIRAEIESSPEFERTVAAQAAALGRSADDVRQEARACLKEMVAAESPSATKAWTKLGAWLARAYEFDVDQADLARLKTLDTAETLVFLPNHRSYLDPFVLRLVLEQAGFPPNFVLGGSNLSFFPLGPIGQHTGLVFIRRQFKDAPVYKAMLGVYLAHLVQRGANLEWYIEGGRTRTGKLRPPRMGILSYLVDAFKGSGVHDVSFVPVSIIYDQQHEVGAIVEEESGGTKAPESVKWALRYARAQGSRRGKVHLRFAEPVSLRAMLDEVGSVEGRYRAAVPKVAFEVCHRINRVTPVTAAAVATLVLLEHSDRALTEAQMRAGALPIAEYLAQRGAPIAGGMHLDRSHVLTERLPTEGRLALETLVREGVVARFDGGDETVYSIPSGRYLEAAFYRNTLSHFFVTRSIVELAVLAAAEQGATDLIAASWLEALALRDLLKYEFFFSTKEQFDHEVRAEMELSIPGWEQADVPAARAPERIRALPFRAAPRILTPFLEAYGVLADRLALRDPGEKVDQDALVAECIGVARQRVLQRSLHSPESVSKDLFKNALLLAGNRDLLGPGDAGLVERRAAFAAELAEVVRRIDVLREMSAPAPGTVAPSSEEVPA